MKIRSITYRKYESSYFTYFNDLVPDQVPTIEWYRPSLQETLKLRKKNPEMLHHILGGGLDFREI